MVLCVNVFLNIKVPKENHKVPQEVITLLSLKYNSEQNIKDMAKKYVIGIDYGTDSVRSVVVDTTNGKIVGTSVFEYPRWKKGLFCDPSINQFRQHPLDYI